MDKEVNCGKPGFVYGAVPDVDIPDWCRGLPEVTRLIMTKHYAEKRDHIISHFAPELTWIGSMEWQFTQGLDRMLEELDRENGIEREIEDSDFNVVYADAHTCTVTGWMKVKTPERTGMLLAAQQRATFQFALFDKTPKAVHIHISNSWDAAGPDEVFPFRAGKETYRYVQDILRRKHEPPKKISIKDVRGNTHYLQVEEIIFIEAQKPYTILYCVYGRIEVNCRLSKLAAELPPVFVQIHRSYIININYVVGFRRFAVHLCEGYTLPIPEKKYWKLKRKVEALLLNSKNK